MKVYRISKCDFINDISGTGAALYGGRWNSAGVHILYTSQSAALALLETVVHLNEAASLTYCMAIIQVPETEIEELKVTDLPEGWQKSPPKTILKRIGDDFIARNESLALKIPSSVMQEENNYLLNPRHPLFKEIKVLEIKPLPLDNRLLKVK